MTSGTNQDDDGSRAHCGGCGGALTSMSAVSTGGGGLRTVGTKTTVASSPRFMVAETVGSADGGGKSVVEQRTRRDRRRSTVPGVRIC
jgi:hypothetical protein